MISEVEKLKQINANKTVPVKKERKNKSNLVNSCCFDENKQKNKTQRIGKNVRNNQGLLSADVI